MNCKPATAALVAMIVSMVVPFFVVRSRRGASHDSLRHGEGLENGEFDEFPTIHKKKLTKKTSGGQLETNARNFEEHEPSIDEFEAVPKINKKKRVKGAKLEVKGHDQEKANARGLQPSTETLSAAKVQSAQENKEKEKASVGSLQQSSETLSAAKVHSAQERSEKEEKASAGSLQQSNEILSPAKAHSAQEKEKASAGSLQQSGETLNAAKIHSTDEEKPKQTSDGISEEEGKQWQAMFAILDADNTGKVLVDRYVEWEAGALGPLAKDHIKKHAMNFAANDRLDIAGFTKMKHAQKVNMEELRKVTFASFDKDGDGTIHVDDLVQWTVEDAALHKTELDKATQDKFKEQYQLRAKPDGSIDLAAFESMGFVEAILA